MQHNLLILIFALVAMTIILFVSAMNTEDVSNATTEEQLKTTMPKSLEEKAYNFVPRGILIFLDDSERTYGALSYSLLTALYQKASPIIVSGSLFFNVISEYNNLPADTPSNLMQRFVEAKNTLESTNASENQKATALKEQKAIYLKASGFNPDDWIIKEIVPNNLYLLITQDYLDSINIKKTAVLDYDLSNISDAELQLGLKINHIKSTTIDSIKPSSMIVANADYFVSALSAIFCERSEYKNKSIPLPSWAIHMNGHGTINTTVVWLKIDDFKKVLTFFEYNIICHLLTYNSCYAAGKNIEIIYKDIKAIIQKTYPFPIIAEALTDAVTFVTQADPILKDGSLAVKTYVKYNDFFEQVIKSVKDDKDNILALDKIDYGQIALALQKTDRPFIQNAAQIKLPGVEWFSVIDAEKNIVSIGSVLAKTRDPEKPLNIVNFFQTDPTVLLLYTQDIPFELIINSTKLEGIVSMIPENALHTIKKISSSMEPELVLDLFMSIEDKYSAPEKIFFIEKISNGSEAIKNVIVYNKSSGTYAFFQKNSEKFIKLRSTAAKKIADQTNEQEYLNLLQHVKLVKNDKIMVKMLSDKAKGIWTQLGSYTFNDEKDLTTKLPVKLGNSCIIEKIETPIDSNLELKKILDALHALSKDGAFLVWVDEITTKYDSAIMVIPNIKDGDIITLTNLIVANSFGQLFYLFTYDNQFYKGGKKIEYDYREFYKERYNLPIKKLKPSSQVIKGQQLPSILTQKKLETIKANLIEKTKKTELLDPNALRRIIAKAKIERMIKPIKLLLESSKSDDKVNGLRQFQTLVERGEAFEEAAEAASKVINSNATVTVKKEAFEIFQALIAKSVKFDEAFVAATNILNLGIKAKLGDLKNAIKIFEALSKKAPTLTKKSIELLLQSSNVSEITKEKLKAIDDSISKTEAMILKIKLLLKSSAYDDKAKGLRQLRSLVEQGDALTDAATLATEVILDLETATIEDDNEAIKIFEALRIKTPEITKKSIQSLLDDTSIVRETKEKLKAIYESIK